MVRMKFKKLKLVNKVVNLPEMQLVEMMPQQKILRVINDPCGSHSALVRDYFDLKQEKALRSIKKQIEASSTHDISNLTNLGAATHNVDIYEESEKKSQCDFEELSLIFH